ncbi:hypothetical protein [Aromatoleum evansii]|uniref:hypothetical protein n=1 Tax=Aromatoleum evansii TaxID=59406 RepID=UPI00145DE02C|nr:hypothetical protein [Aromatoleum evansii]NMG32110.1 hypothetical protein [Aromatoleum evansii]
MVCTPPATAGDDTQAASKTGSTTLATTIAPRLAEAIRGGHYVAPDSDELARAERLFDRLTAGSPPDALRAEMRELGLVIERDGPLVIVREREDALRGRGFYVFRHGARPDVLHVPHGFKDEMTRDIGLALFAEGDFAAAAWNTVPRRYERDGAQVDADLAHLPGTWFNAFVRATARAWPQGRSLQIHGYDPDKRRTEAGADAALILADGTAVPDDALRRQRDCLASRLGRSVALYPDDVRELGGTTNVQGRTLRGLGYGGFVHVEISRSLRLALRDDPAARANFLTCLQP